MDIAPSTVSRTLTLDLIDASGAATPVQAELRYEAQDPYAVVAVFATETTQVRWVFARDLLSEGLYDPAGDGDVHVWPCLGARGSAVVIIELCSPDGEAVLQAKSADVTEFLQRAYELVPAGEESGRVNMDVALAALLEQA